MTIAKMSKDEHSKHKQSFIPNDRKLSSSSKIGGGILQKKSVLPYPIILDGIDVTPLMLGPYIFEGIRERQLSVHNVASNITSSFAPLESNKFQADLTQQRQDTGTFNPRSYISKFVDDVFIESHISGSNASPPVELETLEEQEDEAAAMAKIPTTISLILTETETQFLIDLPSSTVLKGTDEGIAAENDNSMYEFLISPKGRNRKVVSVEVQTVPTLLKSRDTVTGDIKFRTDDAFASVWDMYDTYLEAENKKEDDDDKDDDCIGPDDHKLNLLTSMDSFRHTHEDRSMEKIMKNPRFLDAVDVIERLLANNCYNEQQKRYKGLSDPYEFREDIEFKYRLNHLWTYANDDTKNTCVMCLSWNVINEDIVAAAYGRYFFKSQNVPGAVMIWNIKNPTQPERKYIFPSAAMTLDFSKENPHMLAVGFDDGFVKVLDVSHRETCIVREARVVFEPCWCLVWHPGGDKKSEYLIGGFGNGYVFKFELDETAYLKPIQIMRTSMFEGKLKGIMTENVCKKKKIGVSTYAAARTITLHPVDPSIYYVGTSEGVVYKCSIHYLNQHMELFRAHVGPVNLILFSPIVNKMYITVGDDFYMRLWIDGVSKPVIESPPNLSSITDALLSPLHCTLVVSIRSMDILVWDLQRKLTGAESITKNPYGVKNHIAKFTKDGRCVLVGDLDGNILVFSLEDMPFPAFFHEDQWWQSIKRHLVTQPNVIAEIEKLKGLRFAEYRPKYFN